jgi:nucleotide-binding universal stress UspA family protein
LYQPEINRPMKRFLVPTDFSDHARNAGYYAAKLAKQLNASIVLYHAYTVPAVVCAPPVYNYHSPHESRLKEEVERMERDNYSRLRFFRETILKGKTEPSCSIIQQRTFVNEGISDYANEHESDLIVMGTRGSNHRGDMLIATTTWGVIQKSKVPVLAIPEGYCYRKIENICFATSLKEDDIALVNSLARIAKVFDANLNVVHVCDKPGDMEERRLFDYFSRQIARSVNYPKLNFVLIEHKDISVALAEYIKNNKTNIMALSYEKRNIFEKLFHRSLTRMFALHTEIPLLAFTS